MKNKQQARLQRRVDMRKYFSLNYVHLEPFSHSRRSAKKKNSLRKENNFHFKELKCKLGKNFSFTHQISHLRLWTS
jgi:hypothetical protein